MRREEEDAAPAGVVGLRMDAYAWSWRRDGEEGGRTTHVVGRGDLGSSAARPWRGRGLVTASLRRRAPSLSRVVTSEHTPAGVAPPVPSCCPPRLFTPGLPLPAHRVQGEIPDAPLLRSICSALLRGRGGRARGRR